MSNFNQTNIIKEILQFEYESKMISKGNNFPKLNINEYNLKDICILLHNKIKISEISRYFGWSQKELSDRLELLLKEELIINKQNEYIPYLMVISLEEGKKLNEQLDKIAYNVVKLIEDKFDEIKKETYKFECFKQFKFNEISLFILSNVLLDSIQIDNVEKLFLKSERTSRNGMNYYYSLQEKYKHLEKESLGIYGNMFRYYGDIAFGLYGNERNGINFHTIDNICLETYFGSFNFKSVNHLKGYLLKELLKFFNEKDYELTENLISGFNRLGIMKGNKINIPVLNKDDFYKLNDIANIIKDDYIDVLEKNYKSIHYSYNNSVYSNEISFEEYFIWWYHLLYSRVTDLLIGGHIIDIPNTGNFSYIVS